MFKYRKILLDLDGTILNKDGKISERLFHTLQKSKDKINISFCTGRTPDFVIDLANSIGLSSNHIVDDGSKVIDKKGKTLWEVILPQEVVDYYIHLADFYNFKIAATVKGKEKLNITKNDANLSRLFPYHLSKKQVDVLLNNTFSSDFEVKVVWFDQRYGFNVSITHVNGNKKQGIAFLINHEKLKKAEIIGVGDGVNDLPLFENVGLKVVMSNANDAIKAVADVVVPSIDKDGVIKVFERFVLKHKVKNASSNLSIKNHPNNEHH